MEMTPNNPPSAGPRVNTGEPLVFPSRLARAQRSEGHEAGKRGWRELLERGLAAARRAGATLWRRLALPAARRAKTLTVVESAALGDRRLVAVVECGGQRFLVGSSPSSVSLLARLPDRPAEGSPGGGGRGDFSGGGE